MIGMMYLVLTALLALNISRDILHSFIIINEGLQETNHHYTNEIKAEYDAFEFTYKNNPTKVQPFWDAAQKEMEYADEVFDHIEELKQVLITAVDGEPLPEELVEGADGVMRKPLANVKAPDQYDPVITVMIGQDMASIKGPEEQWSAKQLREKIEEFKSKSLGLWDNLPVPMPSGFDIGLELEGMVNHEGKEVEWEEMNFYHVPLAGVATILTKIQTDIRSAESTVIRELYSEISALDFKFDTLAAKVIAPTNYVLVGEEYKAEVMVAAYSTTQNPKMELGKIDTNTNEIIGKADTSGISYEGGSAVYRRKASAVGLQEWGGRVGLKKPAGDGYKWFPFKAEYMVARPSATVSATKMNVFYIGVDNPVAVSAAGVAAADLSVSMSNGQISKKGNGEYIVRVKKPGKTKVSVSAKKDGKSKSMGSFDFRVKRVPDPVPEFGGKGPGDDRIKKAKAMAQAGVIAKMKNFDFDLKFRVTSFSLTVMISGVPITKAARGNKLTADMKNMLKKAKKGQKIYIEQIKAKGPDGTTRPLGTLSFKVI